MALAVVGQLLDQLVDEIGALRPRTDEAHVAAQHAEDLRQLVDPGGADEAAHAGDPLVAERCPARHAVLLGVLAHAAELEQGIDPAVEPDALLAIEHRAPALQLDRDRGRDQERQGQDQEGQADQNVEAALQGFLHGADPKSVAIDQPARIQAFELDLAALALEEAGELGHLDAVHAAFEQLVDRQAAPLAHRDHDLVGARLTRDLLDAVDVGDHQLGSICGDSLSARTKPAMTKRACLRAS
jgi:hypothetical protein